MVQRLLVIESLLAKRNQGIQKLQSAITKLQHSVTGVKRDTSSGAWASMEERLFAKMDAMDEQLSIVMQEVYARLDIIERLSRIFAEGGHDHRGGVSGRRRDFS